MLSRAYQCTTRHCQICVSALWSLARPSSGPATREAVPVPELVRLRVQLVIYSTTSLVAMVELGVPHRGSVCWPCCMVVENRNIDDGVSDLPDCQAPALTGPSAAKSHPAWLLLSIG